ncbi:EAL domain-containing protein [Geodermatophilus sabuli]|uniref:Diguanylate cyclase (GGDEF) domain-containing protein n=1 Tax=Geodermatophilus sabuli TaxID=1564158 RepID=A0A285EC59_9ACTN|nr:EAL domain-containing protein [Geodermatophilus sabuli]MBB3084101.1 diguanylate cyclase (GGDEF)-like protein [Geodermatophilus sabuli]SNX96625.1 diguanylate cyclase (GGDEF) domain-containing protein [Geodermatophilus sabuli]
MARSRRGRAEDVPREHTTVEVPGSADVRGAEPELRSATSPDSPTQVPARTLVVDRLTDALTSAEHSTAVLLVDLDHFRMVNASRGHGVGDRLLVAIGARLRAAVSGQEETVARFGDDGFVVICEDTGDHSAHALACFLRNILAEPFRIDGAAVHVTASIGVASAPAEAAVSATDLLGRADTAVHTGKSAGRGRVHLYEQTLGDDAADRYALAADLPAALAVEQLHLEYQPIVDLRSGLVVGMEALARWTHPERGPVPPSSFVAAAELLGVAPELDRWVIQRALRDMARLRAAGVVPADAHLAVNLSAADLADSLLFDHLLGWTERCGLPAGQLVLMITETAIMQDTEYAARLLRLLREQGFRVAMDDFGTGYSSLAHLRDLPISALKIDRSFVVDITEQRDALAIVAWIVDLARAVGVAVVAEGVETAEQAALLRGLGCVTAQGWLWGPAVPATALLSGRAWTSPLATGRGAAVRSRRTRRGQRDGAGAHGVERLLELHRDGASIDTIAAELDAEGFRTPAGRRWLPSSVARVISQRIRRSAGTPDDFPDARRFAGLAGTARHPPRRFPPPVGDPDSRAPEGRGRRGGP